MNLLKELVDYGVIALLVFMSFLSLFFFIERLLFFRKIDLDSFKSKKSFEVSVTKHLTIIGTVSSNSPYIGLLGTVLAIMLTFVSMANDSINASLIMNSLALALKATAIGLVVAIISQIFYNILARYIEVLEGRYEDQKV